MKAIWDFWEWARSRGKKRYLRGWMLFGLYLAVATTFHRYFFRNELEWPRIPFSLIVNVLFCYFAGSITWNYMEKRRSRAHQEEKS